MTVRADCTFYFAIVEKPSPTLSEVNTIDNNDYGITMKMIDFPNQPDSTGHSLQNEFLGTGSATSLEATPGLDNHVNQVSLRTLSFRKRLFDEKGHELTAAQDSTVFNFRLYLSNGSDDDLELANMAKYYVTDPDGMLCTWDSETLKFVSSNLNDYAALTAAEKARFTFDTSMYGAISNIPEGYCVEVPNIPVGTKFKVIEREKDIPAGYSFLSYERIGGSYHPDNGDTLNSGWVRANESPKMDVNNKRGWSIEVNKEWSDKDFTSSHDPVFIAVYCNNKIILVLLAVICAAVLVYSLYQGLIIYIPQKQEQHRFSELQQIAEQENREEKDRTEPSQGDNGRPQNESSSTSAGEAGQQLHFDDIAKINSDFRGWLRIDDTIIDYPVVKSPESDPEYYLHRDFDKNYSFSGTPFIGAGADENSDAFVIYAHKMNNGSMFGTLDDYSHTDWAKQHADIEFDTPDEHRVYRVFAAVQTQVGGEDEFKYYEKTGKLSDKEYNAFVKELRDISVIDIDDCPTNKKQILMLSTCSYHTENGRFVVAAYRI